MRLDIGLLSESPRSRAEGGELWRLLQFKAEIYVTVLDNSDSLDRDRERTSHDLCPHAIPLWIHRTEGTTLVSSWSPNNSVQRLFVLINIQAANNNGPVDTSGHSGEREGQQREAVNGEWLPEPQTPKTQSEFNKMCNCRVGLVTARYWFEVKYFCDCDPMAWESRCTGFWWDLVITLGESSL